MFLYITPQYEFFCIGALSIQMSRLVENYLMLMFHGGNGQFTKKNAFPKVQLDLYYSKKAPLALVEIAF